MYVVCAVLTFDYGNLSGGVGHLSFFSPKGVCVMAKDFDPHIDLGAAEERPSKCGCGANVPSAKDASANEVQSPSEPADLHEPDPARGDKPLG